MLCLFERLPLLHDLKSEISNLKLKAEGVSRQLRAWADSLQNSGIRGQRYVNDKTRRTEQRAKEQEEFMEEFRHAQETNIKRARMKNQT